MTALHPILIGTAVDDSRPLHPGDLVTYHGRIRSRRGDVHYVSDVFEGLHLIVDRDYPSVDPLEVRRANIRPTGETVVLCDCGHEAGWSGHGQTYGYCEARPCECDQHQEIRD